MVRLSGLRLISHASVDVSVNKKSLCRTCQLLTCRKNEIGYDEGRLESIETAVHLVERLLDLVLRR